MKRSAPHRRPGARTAGFTLVETLAAGMILAAAGAMLSLSVRLGLQSLQRAGDLQRAAALADRVLTKVDLIGPVALLENGPMVGAFQPPDERFAWAVAIEPPTADDLCRVKVTITWLVRGTTRAVDVETLLHDPPGSHPANLVWESL
ncbi:MAG: type II secretion system protein [Planctomycetes bacterium]|nr:type II secretion system protein [Planctomycetota bacterium]